MQGLANRPKESFLTCEKSYPTFKELINNLQKSASALSACCSASGVKSLHSILPMSWLLSLL